MDKEKLSFHKIYWKSVEKWARDTQDSLELLIIKIEITGTNDWYHLKVEEEVFLVLQAPENSTTGRAVKSNLISDDQAGKLGRVKVLSQSGELTFNSFLDFLKEISLGLPVNA